MNVVKNIKYGQAEFQGGVQELFLDTYRAAGTGGQKLPVIINIHGGSFAPTSSKDGASIAAACQMWAKRGFLAAAIEYRRHGLGNTGMAAVSTYVDPVHDALAAVRYIVNNSEELSADPNNIALYGCSAGGITVSNANLLDVGPGSSNSLNVSTPSNFTVAVSLAGGYTRQLVEGSLQLPLKSPSNIAPHVLLHHEEDPTVEIILSAQTADALEAAGVPNTFVRLPGRSPAGHCPQVAADPALLEVVMLFVLSHMRIPQCTLPGNLSAATDWEWGSSSTTTTSIDTSSTASSMTQVSTAPLSSGLFVATWFIVLAFSMVSVF